MWADATESNARDVAAENRQGELEGFVRRHVTEHLTNAEKWHNGNARP